MSNSLCATNCPTAGETTQAKDVSQMSTAEIFAALRKIHQDLREQLHEMQQEIERLERQLAEARQAPAQAEARPRSPKQAIQLTGKRNRWHGFATHLRCAAGALASAKWVPVCQPRICFQATCQRPVPHRNRNTGQVLCARGWVSMRATFGHFGCPRRHAQHFQNTPREKPPPEGPELVVTHGVLTRSVGPISY